MSKSYVILLNNLKQQGEYGFFFSFCIFVSAILELTTQAFPCILIVTGS